MLFLVKINVGPIPLCTLSLCNFSSLNLPILHYVLLSLKKFKTYSNYKFSNSNKLFFRKKSFDFQNSVYETQKIKSK